MNETIETLKVLNKLQADGVIGKYAIGGAVGALFYLEPMDTEDLDVFVSLGKQGAEIISLAPVYAYLKELGFDKFHKEGVIIAGWPVQFLPVADALDEEALAQAVQTEVAGVPTAVLTAEHLVAKALQVGRGKDHLRILAFIESGRLDPARLDGILQRHDFVAKMKQFEDKFGPDMRK